MAGEKLILQNLVFALDGDRISRNANSFTLPAGRVEVDTACYEDPGSATEKVTYESSLDMEVWGTQSELALLLMLEQDSRAVAFTVFQESDSLASPVAAPGSIAYFMDAKVTKVPMEAPRGGVKKAKPHLVSGGSRLFLGQVLHTNVGAAALGPTGGTPFISTPLPIGVLGAGKQLGWSFHIVNPPGLLGTTPLVTAELVSDNALAFTSPVVRASLTAIATTSGYVVVLDGDQTPFAGEDHWALKLTITGTGAEATVMSAIALMSK